MTELGGGIIAIEGARKPPTNLRFVFIKRFRNYLNKYSGIYNYSLREVLYSNSSIGSKLLGIPIQNRRTFAKQDHKVSWKSWVQDFSSVSNMTGLKTCPNCFVLNKNICC